MRKRARFTVTICPLGVPTREQMEIALRDDGAWVAMCPAIGSRWFHKLDAKTMLAAMKEALAAVAAVHEEKAASFSAVLGELR
jgi:hypothetical protein